MGVRLYSSLRKVACYVWLILSYLLWPTSEVRRGSNQSLQKTAAAYSPSPRLTCSEVFRDSNASASAKSLVLPRRTRRVTCLCSLRSASCFLLKDAISRVSGQTRLRRSAGVPGTKSSFRRSDIWYMAVYFLSMLSRYHFYRTISTLYFLRTCRITGWQKRSWRRSVGMRLLCDVLLRGYFNFARH